MFAYFDIGGTKTRVVISLDGNSFADPLKFNTPKNYEEGMNLIVEKIQSLTGGEPIEAAGGGIAGPVDHEHTMLVESPNLPEWVGKPVVQDLSTRLGCPIYVRNDTAIVGLGEAHHGAGKGDEIMVYITISTGVGGTRIVDGFIDRGVNNFEPGHQYFDIDRTACHDCKTGTAENYLSGTATEHRFHKKAYEIDQNHEVWDELARWTAYMLNNTIVHWSPTSVVLGGSMIVGNPVIPVDRIRDHLNEILHIYPEKPTIKKAMLEDMGGLYGAMVYVGQQVGQQVEKGRNIA